MYRIKVHLVKASEADDNSSETAESGDRQNNMGNSWQATWSDKFYSMDSIVSTQRIGF